LSFLLDSTTTLPADGCRGALAGRVWLPDEGGLAVVAVREQGVFNVSRHFATMSELCESPDPAAALRTAEGEPLGPLDAILASMLPDRRAVDGPWLLAPVDLQAIKAAGVTFVVSMIERVIEERARGNPEAAAAIRAEITRLVGEDLARLVPGSPAAALKRTLRLHPQDRRHRQGCGRAGAGCGRHHRCRRQLRRGLSECAPVGKEPRSRSGIRPSPCRSGGALPRRDHSA
jgi:fumarylacetoacetate (FAA) hydrolase family protein